LANRTTKKKNIGENKGGGIKGKAKKNINENKDGDIKKEIKKKY